MQDTDYFDGTIGGGTLSPDRVRSDLVVPADLVAHSELDREIACLLILHPDLQVKFRQNDLTRLTDETKQLLLEDMQDLLGICR